MDKILTIYIPTYNRLEAVTLLLNEIISSDLIKKVKVFVADDGSEDNTYDILSLKFIENDITIVKYSSNIGIAAGYLKFIELCDTDYFMLMADDDTLNKDGIFKLISFINKVSPAVVSTAWGRLDINNNWVDISRSKKNNSEIKLKDIRGATNHSPGVVFNTIIATKYIGIMNKRLHNKCYATTIYPAVVLSLLIAFSHNKCRWFGELTGGYRSSGALPSNLVDQDGDEWGSFIGRWKEQKSFENIYKYLYSTTGFKNKYAALYLLDRHNMQFYSRLEEALQSDKSNLSRYLLMGALTRIFRSPLISIKIVFEYLVKKFKFMLHMK